MHKFKTFFVKVIYNFYFENLLHILLEFEIFIFRYFNEIKSKFINVKEETLFVLFFSKNTSLQTPLAKLVI
jgi:hypothetical protein